MSEKQLSSLQHIKWNIICHNSLKPYKEKLACGICSSKKKNQQIQLKNILSMIQQRPHFAYKKHQPQADIALPVSHKLALIHLLTLHIQVVHRPFFHRVPWWCNLPDSSLQCDACLLLSLFSRYFTCRANTMTVCSSHNKYIMKKENIFEEDRQN